MTPIFCGWFSTTWSRPACGAAYMALGQIVADAERQPPAVFLLDIMVPAGRTGSVPRLRKNPALSTVPIIFLTARAAENDRVMGWNWARTTTSPSHSGPASWWRG